ncbi:MAG: NADH-quinone oxidoreductase subunit D, partial [Actinomycetota bacterium]|nr:NADH-quinone oxidoreductase subunit D [Actinomycetota bacterium]
MLVAPRGRTPGDLVVGIGAAAHATSDAVLVLGPHHPSSHGVLQLALTLDGDRIRTA